MTSLVGQLLQRPSGCAALGDGVVAYVVQLLHDDLDLVVREEGVDAPDVLVGVRRLEESAGGDDPVLRQVLDD